jgi:hypothetical protein
MNPQEGKEGKPPFPDDAPSQHGAATLRLCFRGKIAGIASRSSEPEAKSAPRASSARAVARDECLFPWTLSASIHSSLAHLLGTSAPMHGVFT